MLNPPSKPIESYDSSEFESTAEPETAEYTIDGDIRIQEDAIVYQFSTLQQVSPWTVQDKFLQFFNSLSALRNSLASRHNEDGLAALNLYESNIRQKLFGLFKQYIGIMPESNAFGSVADLEATELQEFLRAVYEFFVLYRFDMISNFVYNEVVSNFKVISATYKPSVNRQDLGAKTERRKSKNLEQSIVLDKIDSIVKDILTDSFESNQDFMTAVTSGIEDEWCVAVIQDEFDTVSIPNLKSALIGDVMSSSSTEALRHITMRVYSRLSEKFSACSNQ